jgi:predicted GNAT family acetyltransferase
MTRCPDYDVVDDPEEGRYEARVRDGQALAGRVIGMLRYVRQDGVVIMPSTVTDPEFRRHGVASSLTRRALDDAREAGLRVRPDCWYVAEWIEAHPEYADLRA